MMKQKGKKVEFGYDTFTEDQQKAIREIKARLIEITGCDIVGVAQNITSLIEQRKVIAKTNHWTKKIVEMGGFFVPCELIYIHSALLAVFATNEEEVKVMDELVSKLEEVFDQAIKAREEKSNGR